MQAVGPTEALVAVPRGIVTIKATIMPKSPAVAHVVVMRNAPKKQSLAQSPLAIKRRSPAAVNVVTKSAPNPDAIRKRSPAAAHVVATKSVLRAKSPAETRVVAREDGQKTD